MSHFNAEIERFILKFQSTMAKSVRETRGLPASVLMIAGTLLVGSVVAGEIPVPQPEPEKLINEEQEQALNHWSLKAHDVLSKRLNEKLQEKLARMLPTSDGTLYIQDPELDLPPQELICKEKPVFLPSGYSDRTAIGGC